MAEPSAGTAATATAATDAAKLLRRDAAGQLRTVGSVRRASREVRTMVAFQFRDRFVEVVDRFGRTYRGPVLAVAWSNVGTTSDLVIVGSGPISDAVSLATVDSITEVAP